MRTVFEYSNVTQQQYRYPTWALSTRESTDQRFFRPVIIRVSRSVSTYCLNAVIEAACLRAGGRLTEMGRFIGSLSATTHPCKSRPLASLTSALLCREKRELHFVPVGHTLVLKQGSGNFQTLPGEPFMREGSRIEIDRRFFHC